MARYPIVRRSGTALVVVLGISLLAPTHLTAQQTTATPAHSKQGTARAASHEADEAAIRKLDKEWSAAAGEKKLTEATSYYAADASFMPPNSPASTGAGIKDAWGGMFKMPGFHLSFEPTKIEVSRDGTMAYDIGTYSFDFQTPNGPGNDKGKYLVVWVKTNGHWKVAADTFNSNQPQK